jgi:hypothetical protein
MLLAWAQGKGNKVIRRRCGQKNAAQFVAQHRPGMALIAMVFGPHAHDTQIARPSIFIFYFNGLQRFSKLATSLVRNLDRVSHLGQHQGLFRIDVDGGKFQACVFLPVLPRGLLYAGLRPVMQASGVEGQHPRGARTGLAREGEFPTVHKKDFIVIDVPMI